jgi:hypothetical protein
MAIFFICEHFRTQDANSRQMDTILRLIRNRNNKEPQHNLRHRKRRMCTSKTSGDFESHGFEEEAVIT